MSRIVIDCIIEDIVYQNPENGYAICEVKSETEGDFYAVGYMPTIHAGEHAELTGDWVVHPDYGEQFKVEIYNTLMPSSEAAIIKYLSSGVIKGVREATAKKLYKAFGEEVFDVLTNSPDRIAELKGISRERALTMCQSFNEQQSVRNIIMFLQQYNITAHMAMKIHKIFGNESISVIKNNPYSIANAVDGITFKTADTIAFNLGLPKNSPQRLLCATIYFLREAAFSNGHTYLPRDLLIEHMVYNLNVTEAEVENAISELIAERDIISETVDNTSVLYLASSYYDEKYIANRIISMSESKSKSLISVDSAEGEVTKFEGESTITLARKQRNAVVTALSSGVMILTGGPGTGKTTTINAMITIMERLNLKVSLAAPTGRAAKRMAQLTNREAKTIHRLLGAQVMGNTHIFSYDEEHPLESDVIILDEVSMVDTSLMAAFLRAVTPGGRIILSGDSDQLPSVGAGNVLHDLIASDIVPVVKLTDIFRQSEQSLIIINAHRINNGEMPELSDRTKDFFFMRRATPIDVARTVTELYKTRLPKTYGVSPIADIQVLSPTKKGITGTVELNRMLQESINPQSKGRREHKYGQTIFREGDKIMQTRNNYDMPYETEEGEKGQGIYNGDMGIIDAIHSDERYMIITFDDGKIVEYPFSGLDELDLAYAITVHKSQGSEFLYVIIPVSSYMPMLMTRNLLYTAITRAKTMVILVGNDGIIEKMTKNNSYTKRFTGLPEMLNIGLETGEKNEG